MSRQYALPFPTLNLITYFPNLLHSTNTCLFTCKQSTRILEIMQHHKQFLYNQVQLQQDQHRVYFCVLIKTQASLIELTIKGTKAIPCYLYFSLSNPIFLIRVCLFICFMSMCVPVCIPIILLSMPQSNKCTLPIIKRLRKFQSSDTPPLLRGP